MLLTEEQAKSKWCPLSRELAGIQNAQGTAMGSFNRHPNSNIPACITTSCMSWRWATPKQVRDIDLVTSDVVDLEPRRGYCGAFGRPEHED